MLNFVILLIKIAIFSEENRIKLDMEMHEYWNKLFMQLEAQHTLLQVHARIFAYSLRKYLRYLT